MSEPQGKPKNTWVGSLSLSPADLPDPGIKLRSPALQVDSLPTELSGDVYSIPGWLAKIPHVCQPKPKQNRSSIVTKSTKT